IERGEAQYRWDCGSGIGVVRVNNARVVDGKWHGIKVSRGSRHIKVTVDDTHTAEGDSPTGSDVIKLYKNAMRLTFGAQLSYSTNSGSSSLASDLRPLISKGMVGCFGKIGAMHAREGIPPLKYAFGGSRDGRAWPVMIDEKTGKVTTRMSLDYEQQSVHRISLLVTDAGGRRAFSTLILNAIFMVLAIDEDVGDQIEYTVVPDGSAHSNYVKVHPKQGILSLQKTLRELVDRSSGKLIISSPLDREEVREVIETPRC
ncbi:Cadherin-4, partial [Toxocara canis]